MAHVEGEYVHKVYSQIAQHFSDTRFKPWPRIAQFLMDQPPGSLIADVGEGLIAGIIIVWRLVPCHAILWMSARCGSTCSGLVPRL